MKIVYFDVENYEKEFLITHNENRYNYILESNSLNDINIFDREYYSSDVISVFTTSRVNRTVLEKFSNLKLIALRSVGYNHIDVNYCREKGIEIVNSPEYGNESVAEFALGLLLNVNRKISLANSYYKSYKVYSGMLMGEELLGKNIGIVGHGAIGKTFDKIATALGMNVLIYDIKENYLPNSVDFNYLLENSDFITLHAPLTKENYHMFDIDAFKKMKNTSIIINTGRGELINILDLYNALVNREIAGAGLDVLENEETIFDVDYIYDLNRLEKSVLAKTIIHTKLFQLENVIITPHIAYNTKEAVLRILETTMDNIHKFSNGVIQNRI